MKTTSLEILLFCFTAIIIGSIVYFVFDEIKKIKSVECHIDACKNYCEETYEDSFEEHTNCRQLCFSSRELVKEHFICEEDH